MSDRALVGYLSGPMRGIKSYNIPTFNEAAKTLRSCGWHIINPPDLGPTEMREACLASDNGTDVIWEDYNTTWAQLIARDLPLIAGADALILLSGWERSAGAILEVFMAYIKKKDIYEYKDRVTTKLRRSDIAINLQKFILSNVIDSEKLQEELYEVKKTRC